MQNITTFINEALRIKTGIKNISTGETSEYISIDMPDCEDFCVNFKKIIKTIKFPRKRFFIYHDYYRGKMAHLGSLEELVVNMCLNQVDFEDFDITKDILFASNDLKEIAHWYLTSFLSLPEPDPKMFDDGDEYLKFCERKIKQKKYYDNISVLFDFINNNVEIDAIDIKLSDAKIKEKLKDELLDMFEEA